MDTAGTAHLGALIAAKRRIPAMIQDAVQAGLLPKQPWVTRLAANLEAATTNLEAFDDEDKHDCQTFRSEKAAQAADEAWHQTVTLSQHKELRGTWCNFVS